MMTNDPLISIGSVAARTGCAVSAVRFYADRGLVPSVRSAAGHRMFRRSSIRRISFILIAQNLDYSLAEITELLAGLPEQRTPNKRDWDKLSKRMQAGIEADIKRLKRLHSTLSGCIGCGCLSLKTCNLHNPDDVIAVRGTGARFAMGDRFVDGKTIPADK